MTTKTERSTHVKPLIKLVGEDGNIFSIMGRTRKALNRAGLREAATEYTERVTRCGSYDEALMITLEYVDEEYCWSDDDAFDADEYR